MHPTILVTRREQGSPTTYKNFEDVNECIEDVCKIYEEHLKSLNPQTPTITYDVSQLFDFIDQFAEFSCLVYQNSIGTYVAYTKEWIKEKTYIQLRRLAFNGE